MGVTEVHPGSNLRSSRSTSTEKLFYAPAFVIGFGDGRHDRPFRYPDARGPGQTRKSAELAYERGRQFGVLWRDKPMTNLAQMKAALARLHIEKVIT
jgi:hypothetical protein